MAEGLVQRISLSGGDVVRDALMSIGAAGVEAFAKVRGATLAASESGSALVQSTRNISEGMKDVASSSNEAGGALGQLESQSKNVLKSFGLLGGSITATLGLLSQLAISTSQKVKNDQKMSETLGISIGQYQALGLAFRKAGVDQENLTGLMGRFSAQLEKAKLSDKDATGVLGDLGISLKDIAENSDNTAERMEAFAKALKNSGATASQQMAALREVFGRAGAELAPVIRSLAEKGLVDLEALAKKFGLIWTNEQVATAKATAAAWTEFKVSIANVKDQIGLLIAPAVTVWLTTLNKSIMDNKQSLLDVASTISSNLVPIVTALGQAFSVAMEAVKIAFNVAAGAIAPFVSVVNAVFDAHWSAQIVVALAMIAQLTGGFRLLIAALGLIVPAIEAIGIAAGTLMANPFLAAIAVVVAALYALYNNWDTIKADFQKGVAAVTGFFSNAWKGAALLVSGALSAMGVDVKAVFDAIAEKVNYVIGLFKKLTDAIGLTSSAASDTASSAAAPAQGFARGGRVWGPGTSTSDSIPAWLSAGEFVQQAAAVRHYGVDFMSRINNLQFPVGAALRLATGGYVPGATPMAALPETAASSALRPFNLQIGADHFNGLMAPDGVAKALVNFASNKATASLGTKPSWY